MSAAYRLAQPPADGLDLGLRHDTGKGQGQAAPAEVLGDGEISRLVPEALDEVGLQVERGEVGAAWYAERFETAGDGLAVDSGGETHDVDEPAHARRRRADRQGRNPGLLGE